MSPPVNSLSNMYKLIIKGQYLRQNQPVMLFVRATRRVAPT